MVVKFAHLSGVVFDAEFHGRHSGPEIELVESMVIMTFLQKRGIRRLREVGFIVQQM